MPTKGFLLAKYSHLEFILGFTNEFVCGNMLRLLDSFWVFVCKFLVCVFGLIITHIFRIQTSKSLEKNESGSCVDSEFGGLNVQKQSHDAVDKESVEREDTGVVASTNKYELLCGKDISGFIEEPKTECFIAHELCIGSDDYSVCSGLTPPGFGRKDVVRGIAEDSVESFVVEKNLVADEPKVKLEAIVEAKTEDSTKQEDESFESYIVEWILQKEEQMVEFDAISEAKIDDRIEEADESFDCFIDEVILAKEEQKVELEAIFEPKTEELIEDAETSAEEKAGTPADSCIVSDTLERQEEVEEEEDAIAEKEDELVEISERCYEETLREVNAIVEDKNHKMEKTEDSVESFICENASEKREQEIEGNDVDEEKAEDSIQRETEREGEAISDYYDEIDYSFEDDDLMNRLRMELKMSRTGGLPTILEESEFPTVEPLKPLKIDQKLDHKGRITEIQKFYKIYVEKMRKLEILNSQTMLAISLLQLKHSAQQIVSEKSSAPSIKSLLTQNMRRFKQQKPKSDRARASIRDLQRDLETVYVGQACLSWEILQWQRGKAQELLENDSQGLGQYNQVAGEFQLFQVFVQRFLENEPFQGRPRVEHYAKSRSVLPNFLQVPVIKDDCSKEEEEDAISTATLTRIIEETMRVFWEFLRADKNEASVYSKAPPPQQWQVAPEGPLDLELLMGVRSDFQKKEKRVKEMLRRSNFVVTKKFHKQKHQGQASMDDGALLRAQVELKLVSRVLKMSKLNVEQLVWCHQKLDRIKISSRVINIEPSILFFPC